MTMIDRRPDRVAIRNSFGYWEADTVVSRESAAVLMVVYERKSRLALIRKRIGKNAERCAGRSIDSLLKSRENEEGDHL